MTKDYIFITFTSLFVSLHYILFQINKNHKETILDINHSILIVIKVNFKKERERQIKKSQERESMHLG